MVSTSLNIPERAKDKKKKKIAGNGNFPCLSITVRHFLRPAHHSHSCLLLYNATDKLLDKLNNDVSSFYPPPSPRLFLLPKSSSVSSASWRHCCLQPPPALLPVSATQMAWWTAGAGDSRPCPPFTSCLRGVIPSSWPTTSSPRWERLPSPTSPLWRFV